MNKELIILYDDMCGICRKCISFIQKRDLNTCYAYIPLKSKEARDILQKAVSGCYEEVISLDTLIVIDGSRTYIKSAAVINIIRNLKGLWKFFYSARLIPQFLRDPIYDFIVRKRYKMSRSPVLCLSNQKPKFMNNS